MKRVLHVGCGRQRHTGLALFRGWEEVRLDIEPAVRPDIVASITDMGAVPSASFDAVYSSHNLEHLYAHEVPVALREFRRVLKDDGLALVATPDLQAVAKLIAEGGLEDTAYVSPSGPIAPLDILYGHRPSVAAAPSMAHRTGFTSKSLLRLLAGSFASALCARSGFQLTAIATRAKRQDAELRKALEKVVAVR